MTTRELDGVSKSIIFYDIKPKPKETDVDCLCLFSVTDVAMVGCTLSLANYPRNATIRP